MTHLYEHDAALLVLRMGGGKTVVTGIAIAELYAAGEIETALVVAPRAVADTTWRHEFGAWEELAGLTVSVALGTARQRVAALTRPAHVHVVTYDNLQWLEKVFAHRRWDLIVMDEITRFNRGGKRYKAFRHHLRLAHIRWGLTGSLMASSPLDAYFPVCAVDLGETWGPFVGRFRREYATKGQWEWQPLPDAPRRIADAIAHLVYLPDPMVYQSQLPPVQRIDVEFEIGEPGVYHELCRDYMAEMANGLILTVASAGVLGNKLAQVVSGFLYYDDGTVDRFDEKRLQVLDEIIAEADGPVLLWYWFAETGAALRERYRAPQLLDVLEEWRRGEVPVAVCHPRSGGHGVNAQADDAIMVWVEHTWSDEERAQAEARLHRQGQRTAVRIYSLMARVEGVESIDHTMRKKREGKRSMADAVTDHLKTTTAAGDGGVPANPTEG